MKSSQYQQRYENEGCRRQREIYRFGCDIGENIVAHDCLPVQSDNHFLIYRWGRTAGCDGKSEVYFFPAWSFVSFYRERMVNFIQPDSATACMLLGCSVF